MLSGLTAIGVNYAFRPDCYWCKLCFQAWLLLV